MDRRSFLKKGLLGGAILALGAGGLSLYPTRHIASPTGPLLVLDDHCFQVMVAIAARVLPAACTDPVAIAHSVDKGLSHLPREAQEDIKKLLGLFENALPGLLLDGRAQPFTRLDGPEQDRVLERWRESRLTLRRGGYQALRRLCLGAFYQEPSSWPKLQYPGPPDTAGFSFDDSRAGTPAWIAEQAALKDAPKEGAP